MQAILGPKFARSWGRSFSASSVWPRLTIPWISCLRVAGGDSSTRASILSSLRYEAELHAYFRMRVELPLRHYSIFSSFRAWIHAARAKLCSYTFPAKNSSTKGRKSGLSALFLPNKPVAFMRSEWRSESSYESKSSFGPHVWLLPIFIYCPKNYLLWNY